jgi:hypothetical protein
LNMTNSLIHTYMYHYLKHNGFLVCYFPSNKPLTFICKIKGTEPRLIMWYMFVMFVTFREEN